MEVNGVLITKEFKRVYVRIDNKVKSKLSVWSNKLEGHGLVKDSFVGATFVLFDTTEGFIVLVVLQNRFALLLGNNASSIEQQCFFLSPKLRNMFNNVKISSVGLFKSKTMEDALTKAFEEGDFKHTTSSVILKYCVKPTIVKE